MVGRRVFPEVERLRSRLSTVEPYPEGVVVQQGEIAGTAFFPGGSGVWLQDASSPDVTFPSGKVMVLGQDFHTASLYEASRRRGQENLKTGAWKSLLALLEEVPFAPSECFFTNAFMGLRASGPASGEFPGWRDKSFVERCRGLFREQLSIQQPRLVLVLGVAVARFVSPVFPELDVWSKLCSKTSFLQSVDEAGKALVEVRDSNAGRNTGFVFLTHPSYRFSNVRLRRYGTHSGVSAELALLRDALRKAMSRMIG